MTSESTHVPIACTLDAAGAVDQLEDWAALQALCTRVVRTPQGAVLWFQGRAERQLRAVVEREAECCRFLDLDIAHEGGFLRLRISSETPESEPVIALLAAQASGR